MGKIKEFYHDIIEKRMREDENLDDEYFYRKTQERLQEEEEYINSLKNKTKTKKQ